MKKILMTLLCFVGLTGLAGSHEFDKTKLTRADGFEGGTLNQDALVLQITAGDQLAYFKAGDTRSDGHIISQAEEGFYAGIKMGWNADTWAYAKPSQARFQMGSEVATTYTGEDVQNGRLPGLSIATKTAAATYVTSFTYWAKVEPTQLVQGQTYKLPLWVWSNSNTWDHHWNRTMFEIQVLVSESFTLTKPDGEQVFPVQTKLFEKLKGGYVAQYENMSYCGNVQKAYEKAIADAEARAKQTGSAAVVQAFIKMEADSDLDPSQILAPKSGKIVFNLNGHHLTLLSPLPNAGCIYEFRDTSEEQSGLVESKAEGWYMLAEYKDGASSTLVIHGGSYACLPFGPSRGSTVKIFNAKIVGQGFVKGTRARGEANFAARGELTTVTVDDKDYAFINYSTHVHKWNVWSADEVMKKFNGAVDTNTCVVVSCTADNCPLKDQNRQEFFILHIAQAGDSITHQYPFNIRYFNGTELPMGIYEDEELTIALLQQVSGRKPAETYAPFFKELDLSTGYAGSYATSVSATSRTYADENWGNLKDYYAKFCEMVAKCNDEQYTNVFMNVVTKGKDFGHEIQKCKADMASIAQDLRLATDQARIDELSQIFEDKQAEYNNLTNEFAKMTSEVLLNPELYAKFAEAKFDFAQEYQGKQEEIRTLKQDLQGARNAYSYYQVENAQIYNPGHYDIRGVLHINKIFSSEPDEWYVPMSNDAEILPLPLTGENGSKAFEKDGSFRLDAVLSFGGAPVVPYAGSTYNPWISRFEYLVNGRLANDVVPDAGTYRVEKFMSDDRDERYVKSGLTVISGDEATNPGTYVFEVRADHAYNVARAQQGEYVSQYGSWCDPFFGENHAICSWTILDAPVMVQVQTAGLPISPFLSLQEAADALEDEDFTARITQDLLDGRAEGVTVPANFGFLNLGKCGVFTLDLCGYMIGNDKVEPGESVCIINDGTMKIIDTMLFGAANVAAGGVAKGGRTITELAKQELAALVGDKGRAGGTVYGQVINNGTMTIGTGRLLSASGTLGKNFKASPVFNDLVSNNGTMTILSGTFERGLENLAGTVEIRDGVFEGPIGDKVNGVTVYGGQFSKDTKLEDLQAMLAPGYQIVEKGDTYVVVPHEHVYELEMLGMIQPPKMLQAGGLQGFSLGGTGFTLTCTNDPICLVRKGEFRMKSPEDVNKLYDREPLDAVPYVCTITDDVTGEQKEVSLGEFIAAFADILTITKPFYPKDSPTDANKYEAGIGLVASNVVVEGELKDEQFFSCKNAYEISPRPLSGVTLQEYEFKYDGYEKIVTVASVTGEGGFVLNEKEWHFDDSGVSSAVGSPFELCGYSAVIAGNSPNFTGTASAYWTIREPSGNFAGNAATEALNGNEPCGDVTGNPDEGFSLFVTNPQNMVYDAATSTWFAGLTVTWPYKTALLAANREYTPAGDAYFLSSTDPTNVVTAAQIRDSKGEIIKGSQMDVSIGKDGISDVPGVKQFTWWVEINKDDAKKAKAAFLTVQAEAGARDALETNGVAIAQQLVNAQTICEFIAEGLEKEALVYVNNDKQDAAAKVLNSVRTDIAPFIIVPEVTSEVISNHIAVVTALADYIATGDEDKYVGMTNQWAAVFGEVGPQPTEQSAIEFIMNNWAKLSFQNQVEGGEIKLPEGIGYNGSIMPECARNLYIVENYDHVTYTLTAWGVAGPHDEDGVKATDFNIVIDLDDFELVEDNLDDAEVALVGDENFDAKMAAYNFDRNAHSVTVPEQIKLGINTLTKGVDFEVVGEGVKQTGSPDETCFYTVTLTAIDGRGITGTKTLPWRIIAPSGSFGEVTIANGATVGDTKGDKSGITFFFTDDNNPNAGLKYYTEAEASAAGLASEGWYAAVKVVVPVDGVDFMKPSQLYFSANGSGFNANSCKDAINEYGVKSEVTEDVSTWWYPCVRSFTWWTRIDEADVKKATDAKLSAITNTISAYGLAWRGDSALLDLGSAGIRRHEFNVVIDINKIELIDADDIQHWPQHNHNWQYTLTDGTNLTANCMLDPCRQSQLKLTLVGPADKVYDGTASVATLEGDKAFLFYTGSKHGPIMYYNEGGFSNETAPVNAGTYTAKLGVDCALWPSGTEQKTLEYAFTIAAQTTEPGEITAVLNKDVFDYTGSALKPAVTVAYKGKPLQRGVDYTLSGDLEGAGSGSTNAVYEITVSSAVNYAFEPIVLTWTVKAPTGSFTDVAKASADLGGEFDDNTLAFDPGEEGAEVFNSGLVYFTAEEAIAANAGDTAGWYAGLTVKLPVSTWTFTTPEHLLFTYYGKQIPGSTCPYQTEDGLRLTLDTGVTAGGIGGYKYVNSFTWWERIDLWEIEAARAPFIHYPEVATNLAELAKATTYLGEVALPKSAGWYVTHGDSATALKYCNMIVTACGGNPLASVTAQTVTNLCEVLTGYANYVKTGLDLAWYAKYAQFLTDLGMEVKDPQEVFAKIPGLVAVEGQFENREDGSVAPLVTKFDAAKLDEDCTTIMMADLFLEIAELGEFNVISRSLTAAATTWSGKVIGIDTYGDKNGIAEQTFRMEVDVNELSTFWDNEGHRFYPPHDHQYVFSVENSTNLVAQCTKQAEGCPYPVMQLYLSSPGYNWGYWYDGSAHEAALTATTWDPKAMAARTVSVATFLDYTASSTPNGFIYRNRDTGACTTNEAPTLPGWYEASVDVVSVTNKAENLAVTNTLKTLFSISKMPLNANSITVDLGTTDFMWNGATHSVAIKGVYNGSLMLDEDVDYEIDTNSVFSAAGIEGEDVSYPVVITGLVDSCYTGVRTNWWHITTGQGWYTAAIGGEKTYERYLENVFNRTSVKDPVDVNLGKSYSTYEIVDVDADLFGRTKLFDLRGKTVTHTQYNGDSTVPYLRNSGVLTITDSVGGGMLSNVNASALLIENRQTLTIEKGAFVGKIKNTGKLTIRDGAFTGDFVSGDSNLAEEILRASTITLEISGGTFNGDLAVNAGKATITGGTFNGASISKNLLAKIEITGGKFKADPGAYLAKGYVADKNDDGYWYVTPHVHAYTFQQIPAEGAVLMGECFTNAFKRIACDERIIKAELTAEDQPFTGKPYAATLVFGAKDSVLAEFKTLTEAQYVELTGAVISNIVYSKNGEKMDPEEVIMPGAGYKAEVTIVVTNTAALTGEKAEKTFKLTKTFSIASAPFDDVEVVTTPDIAEAFVYTGEDITLDISAYLDVGTKYPYELTEGEDFYITGVTSTNAMGEFSFTLEPDGANFTGAPKTFTWKIVEPNGSFAADAMSAAVADGAPAYGEVVEGTNLVITASTNLWYDADAECWFAGFEIAWPFDLEQVLRAPTYTDPDHALVKLSTEEALFSLTDVATGKVEAAGFDASLDQFYRIKHGRNETYVKGVEWIVPFTFDMITNALAQGETELSYEISVMSPAWENNPHGLKATTYRLTLPLDDNLVLWDEMGRQLYPVHTHEWTYALFADDGIVTNRLTAICEAEDCPQGSLTVALGAEAGTDKEYDGAPLVATLVGAEEFAIHTGATFGKVYYETEDGIGVNGEPVDAGVYFAKATVTLSDGTTFTLELKFVIGERDLHRGYIELKGGSDYNYVGYAIDVDEDAMKVHYLGQTLVRDQDYAVDAESVFVATGSGVSNTTYKITVEGLGNYTNTLSFYWTIYAPAGGFGRTDKATGFTGGEFADATTLVLTNANEVNYGLKYYTADEAPDGSGVAGWYAGIKVDVPHSTFDYTPASKMFFNDVDLDETFSGEACPYDGVSLAISQVLYKYVTSFTWWTRITLDDVIDAEGADIVRTLKATGLAWRDGGYGSAGLAETTYQIAVKTENIVLFDDRGVQLYPHHDHLWYYEIGESAIRATCLAEECPVMACELNFAPIVHEQSYSTTAADSAELLGAETFALHVGAEIGEFRFFDLEGEEIDAPSLVGEYLATVEVALPLMEGGVLTNTLSTTVSVVKTEGAAFDADALEPYDFNDGNQGGYGTVVDRTSVVVTDSTKFAYDPATRTWFAGVFVEMPNGYYGGDLFANQIKDETTFLSVSTAEGVYYADKVAAGEALTDELLEIKDKHSTGIFFPGVDYLYSIGWKIPLTIADIEKARAAGETEIVRTITIGANSRASSEDPLDWGSKNGVVPTAFTLTIPLEGLVLVDENGEEVWPLRNEASGVVTYPKANASTGLVKVNTTATWKAKPNANSVFGHWEWTSTNAVPAAFAALSENEKKSPTLKVKPLVGEQIRPTDFAAVWYRIDEDLLGEVTLTPSNLVTESKSYVTASISGLPTGLKFNKKSLALTGAAKKAQTKTVKITVKNGSGYTLVQSYTLTVYGDLTVALSPIGEPVRAGAAVLAWGDASLGTTKGAKVYLTKSSNQKVSLKATPVKGAIFLGWYDDPAFSIPAKWLPKGYLTASQTVQAPAEGFEVFARFVKLETWTVGTFDGIYLVPGEEDDAPQGKITLTVSSAGKVSGKTTVLGKSYSFSAVAFDDCLLENGELCFTAHTTEKTTGRKLAIYVSRDEASELGSALVVYGDGEDAPWATAVQNGWKLKPAVLPTFLTGSSAITLAKDGLSFKFGSKGVVKVSGKVNGASVSQSAQLLPASVDAELDGGPVIITAYVYVATAPKSGLPNGFYEAYPVTLTVTNGTVTKIEFVEEEEDVEE